MAEFAQKRRILPTPPGAAGAKAARAAGPASGRLARLSATLNACPQVRQLAARRVALSRAFPAQRRSRGASDDAGLPEALKQGVEALSGLSLDGVRVHRDSSKPAELDALAYAQGDDIHLGPGQERQLPHEAWHVVQQKQGRVKPTRQLKDAAVNDDRGLEAEAERRGAEAMRLAARRSPDGSDGRGGRPLAGGRSSGAAVQLADHRTGGPSSNNNNSGPSDAELIEKHNDTILKIAAYQTTDATAAQMARAVAATIAKKGNFKGHASGTGSDNRNSATTEWLAEFTKQLAKVKAGGTGSGPTSSGSSASSSGARHSQSEAEAHANKKAADAKKKKQDKMNYQRLKDQGKEPK